MPEITTEYVFDFEGRQYIDICMSHGASLLGHDHPKIKAAVTQAVDAGILCSYKTKHHVELAKQISAIVPCAEMVRFAGSGTETIMQAYQPCRTVTGREKIMTFEDHFHGCWDDVNFSSTSPLDEAGDPFAPPPYPQSQGIPTDSAK